MSELNDTLTRVLENMRYCLEWKCTIDEYIKIYNILQSESLTRSVIKQNYKYGLSNSDWCKLYCIFSDGYDEEEETKLIKVLNDDIKRTKCFVGVKVDK